MIRNTLTILCVLSQSLHLGYAIVYAMTKQVSVHHDGNLRPPDGKVSFMELTTRFAITRLVFHIVPLGATSTIPCYPLLTRL